MIISRYMIVPSVPLHAGRVQMLFNYNHYKYIFESTETASSFAAARAHNYVLPETFSHLIPTLGHPCHKK